MFHNQQVVVEFLTIVIAMFVVPLSTYYFVYRHLSVLFIQTDANRMVLAGLLSALSVWVVMGVYIYRIVTDPKNFPNK